MGDFTPLPIYPDTSGIGLTRQYIPTKYHMNRFRICVAPGPAANAAGMAAIGANLLTNMPNYMNPHTAKVALQPRQWAGQQTLRFVGVARFRPFSVPIYDPIHNRWWKVPVSEKIRDWMIPDVHPDVVGVQVKTANSFTALTLKRNYWESSDVIIKAAALALLAGAEAYTGWIPIINLAEAAIEEIAAAYVIWVNQHHFLAGRRSFKFDQGVSFGYTDGRYVFETAAMERFSLLPYTASQLAAGDAEDIVRPVWVEMVQQFAAYHNLRIIPDTARGGAWKTDGPVSYLQRSFYDYNAMIGSGEGRDIAARHPEIHP